jgi:hypothetical protein
MRGRISERNASLSEVGSPERLSERAKPCQTADIGKRIPEYYSGIINKEICGRRYMLNHANGLSGLRISPQREERADIGKDDVVEARKGFAETI